jgi:phosphomevalonate kinase
MTSFGYVAANRMHILPKYQQFFSTVSHQCFVEFCQFTFDAFWYHQTMFFTVSLNRFRFAFHECPSKSSKTGFISVRKIENALSKYFYITWHRQTNCKLSLVCARRRTGAQHR